MTFVPKSYEMSISCQVTGQSHAVYHIEKLDSVAYFLGRERGLWSWLWHRISPWEAVLVLDESSCWHQPGLLYESGAICTWDIYCWGRHIYIANTTSGTSGDFNKFCNTFIQVHIQWCARPPPPTHTHVHTCTHTNTSTYVDTKI